MKSKTSILIILLLVITLVPFVSSAYLQDTSTDLKIPTNLTSCYVTITFPNSTNLVYNETMSVFNTGYANYTFDTNVSGEYFYFSNCGSGTFQVTYNGEELTTPIAILNLGFLVLLIFLFLITCFAIANIGDNESRDDYGQLLSVDSLKYFKGFLVAVAYAMLIAVFFTASNISIAYLTGTMFGQLLFVIYKILMWMSIPFVVIWLIWLFVNIFKDKEVQSLINRGAGGDQV